MIISGLCIFYVFSWLDYTPLNTWIENTRLVPFKCPLRRVKYKILGENIIEYGYFDFCSRFYDMLMNENDFLWMI
jgi:hypothetical protein